MCGKKGHRQKHKAVRASADAVFGVSEEVTRTMALPLLSLEDDMSRKQVPSLSASIESCRDLVLRWTHRAVAQCHLTGRPHFPETQSYKVRLRCDYPTMAAVLSVIIHTPVPDRLNQEHGLP